MEACKLSLYSAEVRSLGTSLPTKGRSHGHNAAEFRARCSYDRTKPKLRHDGASSFVPSSRNLGASRRSVSRDKNVTKCRVSMNAVQVVDPEAKAEGDEQKLLEAFRDALKLDTFTLSAYDTAWVAMIPSDKMDGPFYPQTLEWISSNQRHDGAWGDASSAISFDHVLSTLACVVALRTWSKASAQSIKGEQFLQSALSNLKDDDLKFVGPGIFHAFAELLEAASKVGVSFPHSSSILRHFCTYHDQLLDSLGRNNDLLKTCPRKLLSFPEGLQRVISWKEISELQSVEGDLFSSPAATACFVMSTRDSKAFGYLNRLLEQFGSAVPSVYPKRPSHLLNLVDHLERLNVARHFHKEIYDVLDTLSRERKLKADEATQDLVSEVVIFRALREHGYNVLPDTSVFATCCHGSAAVAKLGASCMLELYRASELKFPGEEILDYVKDRSTTYLTTMLLETVDKDPSSLKEEIKYALDFPHYMRYQPVESMRYMDRFQVKDQTKETYIERGFSRVTHAGNLRLLALAKSNFNSCQALYQKELQILARWEEECMFKEISFARQVLYPSYLTAAGTACAPELALARASWTMNSVLSTIVDDLFDETSDLSELRLFVECIRRWDLSLVEGCAQSLKSIARGVVSSTDYLSKEASKLQGRDISHLCQRVWLDLVVCMLTEAEWAASGYIPGSDEYIDVGLFSFALGPIVPTSVFFLGEVISDEHLESSEYWGLFRSSSAMGRLMNDTRTYQRDAEGGHVSAVSVHMREHPELTKEQAWAKVNDLAKESASKALSQILDATYSCSPVRAGWLGMMRALYMMYYRNADGFTNTPMELKKKIQRFCYQPFPMNEAQT